MRRSCSYAVVHVADALAISSVPMAEAEEAVASSTPAVLAFSEKAQPWRSCRCYSDLVYVVYHDEAGLLSRAWRKGRLLCTILSVDYLELLNVNGMNAAV